MIAWVLEWMTHPLLPTLFLPVCMLVLILMPMVVTEIRETKQAMQLGYTDRIIYSNILLFDLKKRAKCI